MCHELCIPIPNSERTLRPANIVQLGRFNKTRWVVSYGWYSVNGNRSVCGWYLVSEGDGTIRALQLIDLDDIYILEV